MSMSLSVQVVLFPLSALFLPQLFSMLIADGARSSCLCYLLLAVLYGANQKKFVPKPLGKYLSRLFLLPTLPMTMLQRSANYFSSIDRTILLGAVPLRCLSHVGRLKGIGVTGIVNVMDEYEGPSRSYLSDGIQQLHLPTVDHAEPSVEQLKEAMNFIEDHRSKSGRVYIHCKAGHGRSAAVALAWLVYHQGCTLENGQQQLNAVRKVRRRLFDQKNLRTFAAKHAKVPDKNEPSMDCEKDVALCKYPVLEDKLHRALLIASICIGYSCFFGFQILMSY